MTSFVQISGLGRRHSCGYCKSDSGSVSFGMWAYHLTVQDYQDLIDRGWRRSGKYLYKPEIGTTCCPAYTIRLDVTGFKPSKGNRKVISKMRRWVGDGKGGNAVVRGLDAVEKKEAEGDDADDAAIPESDDGEGRMLQDLATQGSQNRTDIAVEANMQVKLDEAGVDEPHNGVAKLPTDSMPTTHASQDGSTANNTQQPQASVPAPVPGSKRKREKVPWVKPDKSSNKDNTSSSICDLIQTAEQAGPNGHRLRVEIVPSKFEEETYKLFERYQRVIHNDDSSERGYTGFLVDSPLIFIPPDRTKDPPNFPGYGSFHQKYYMDDKLIAVAVIDILPNCLSSVYLMYDPSPEVLHLSMGTYTALREISTTFQWHADGLDKLKHYYMGYYIHTCKKMIYKAQFKPSDLACPVTGQWVPVDICKPWLDQDKVVRLSTIALPESEREQHKPYLGPQSLPQQSVSNREVENAKCFHDGNFFLLKNAKKKQMDESDKRQVKALYARIGPALLNNLVIVV